MAIVGKYKLQNYISSHLHDIARDIQISAAAGCETICEGNLTRECSRVILPKHRLMKLRLSVHRFSLRIHVWQSRDIERVIMLINVPG